LDFVWIAAALPDASHLNLPLQAPRFRRHTTPPPGAFRETDGSNPFPSSGESGANLSLVGVATARARGQRARWLKCAVSGPCWWDFATRQTLPSAANPHPKRHIFCDLRPGSARPGTSPGTQRRVTYIAFPISVGGSTTARRA
jgi:hypothetical protein